MVQLRRPRVTIKVDGWGKGKERKGERIIVIDKIERKKRISGT